MLTTGIPTVAASCGLSVVFPALAAAEGSGLPPWAQGGVAIAALGLLFVLLRPLINSQVASNERMAKSMEESAKSQAATAEIQRSLLAYAERGALADQAVLAAVNVLADKVSDLDRPRT